jgi:hypothetical protein
LPISLYRQSQRFRFYLRWRAEDETRAIGDRVLWALVDSNELPSSLRGELIAIEIERLTLNMQASSLANLSARAKVALQKVTAAESRLVSCS